MLDPVLSHWLDAEAEALDLGHSDPQHVLSQLASANVLRVGISPQLGGTGGNLADALGNLSAVLRARRMMGEKIKALSSEAIASAGIIASLPPAVMILVMLSNPSYMMLMFTDIRGQVMLMGAALWMATGVFVMKRMISFKF